MSTQSFQLAVGESLLAASIPAGQIAGITIDNPSGFWLQLFPTRDLIPPFTIGYARSFTSRLANIDIRVQSQPTYGVIFSSAVGTGPIVTLYAEPVGYAPGVPLNQANPLRVVASTFSTQGNATGSQYLISMRINPGANVVVFVRRVEVCMDATAALVGVPMLARMAAIIRTGGGTVLTPYQISVNSQPTSPSVVVYGATASNGGALTPIVAVDNTTQRQRFLPRHETAAGYYANDSIMLLAPTDPPLVCSTVGGFVNGIGVHLTGAALSNPATNLYVVNMEWEEYTP